MADVMHVLHRLVNHLGAFAGNVEVGKHGRIVQIDISNEQIRLLDGKERMDCRPLLLPDMNQHMAVNSIRITGYSDADEKNPVEEKYIFRPSGGQELFGVVEHSTVDATLMGGSLKTIVNKDADGKEIKTKANPGRVRAFFEGTFVRCFVPGDASSPSLVRYAFDRQVLSNFCELERASPLRIGQCDSNSLHFDCAEALFQYCKIVAASDLGSLQKGITITKPALLKKHAGSVDVPEVWFNPSAEHGDPVAWTTMNFVQLWAATDVFHHSLLFRLMSQAVSNYSVTADQVFFHEHNEDPKYGTKCNPKDFDVLFDRPFNHPGSDRMGKALTHAAQKVYELKTYGNYIDWYTATFADSPLFVLKKN